MMDYELVESGPSLRKVLAAHPAMHPLGRKYIADFLERLSTEELKGERGERQTSIFDLLLPPDEADTMREARAGGWGSTSKL
jgi:hypothetical protein